MTPAGWVVLVVSVASVLAMSTFTLVRVLRMPAPEEDDD